MTLILGDGFDHYPSALVLSKWDSLTAYNGGGSGAVISTAYGRLGSQGVALYGSLNGGLIKNIYTANSGYGFLGVAMYVPSYGAYAHEIFSVYDNTDLFAHTQCTIMLNIDGSITACYRDGGGGYGTVLASSAPGRVAAATWNYIEAKIKVHNTSGEVEVRVNGVVVLSATGINTRHQTANNYFTRVGIGGTNGFSATWEYSYFDDFYYCDDAGTVNNTYLGDVRLGAIYPNGVGSSTVWTPVGIAANWGAVSEHSPDDDTTYVWANTVGNDDLYTMDDVAATVSGIKGLLINCRIRKDDATARTYAALVKPSGSAASEVATRTVPGGYSNQQDVSELNPATSAAWTAAQVNAMEAGIRVKS